jgi:cellulose biosynthesis protein BcsQ
VKQVRTLLLAGAFQVVLSKYGLDIVNRESIALDEILPFLQQNRPAYDQIVITDSAMPANDIYAINTILKSLLILQEKEQKTQPVLLITNNALLHEADIPGVEICRCYTVRIAISQYLKIISRSGAQEAEKPAKPHKNGAPPTAAPLREALDPEAPAPKAKKHNLLERFKKDKAAFAPQTAYAEREFAGVSGEISRVIAITGCRGAGVTSTAVNLAHIASTKGLSTMLIDLDVLNCALNLYFNEYYETAERDRDIACSLIRNLAKPQDYKLNTYYRDNNLYVTTLAYSFREKELLERFYTAAKLVNMLTVFRKHFQLCVLDMPLTVLGEFTESILYIDDFGLCVPNNLYALTGALRSAQNLLRREDTESLFSKAKIIVSKYNGRATLQDEAFSPERVCELLTELSDTQYENSFELAGFVPYAPEFDAQLETDIPIAGHNAQLEKAYTDILLRMIKGVR